MRKLFGILLFVFISFSLFAESLPTYQKLCSKLKNLNGWKAEKCNGMNMSSNMGQIVTASKEYTKGKKNFTVAVFSGMQAMGYWSQFSANIQMETNEMYLKTTKINGFPAGISMNKIDKSGGIFVCLNKNPQQCISVLAFTFENMDKDEALKLAKKFDWNSIANFFH